MATQVNLYPDQGTLFRHRFLYRDRGTKLPIPVTGWTIEVQVRPYAKSPDILFDGDTAAKGNVAITDGDNGEITLTIPAATTAAWRADEAVYDVKGTPPAGDPERIAEGQIFLSRSTTR